MGTREKTQVPTAAQDVSRPPLTRGMADPRAQLGNKNWGSLVQAHLQATDVVRFKNGEEVTKENLLRWAITEHVLHGRAPQDLVREVEGSQDFTGSVSARKELARFLSDAINESPLAQRYAALEAQRLAQQKHDAEQGIQQALEREIRIEVAKKEDLAASMSALDDPELLPIYRDWLVLHGRAEPSQPNAAQANAPAMVTIGSAASAHARLLEVRASIESRLQEQGLDLATFDKRIAHFEEVFRDATVEMGIAIIDRTEALCHENLKDIDAVASKVFTTLAPVRTPVLAALTRARKLTGEAYRGELDALNEPLRAKAAPQLRRGAEETRKSAHELIGLTLGENFSFIAWPDFPREKLARCDSREAVRSLLTDYFNDHVSSLARAREQLKSDPKRIYRLDLLLANAQEVLEIEDGSILGDIIQQQVRRAAHMGPLEALETVVGFALTVVTIFVPAAAPVTLPLGAGLSVHGAVKAVENYREGAADYRSGLSSDMPSMGWVIFALAGAALDAPIIMKFLRFKKLWDAVRNLKRSRDVERFAKELGNLPESLPEAARAALERAARSEINAAGRGEPPGRPSWWRRLLGIEESDPNRVGRTFARDGWQFVAHEQLLLRLEKGIERGLEGPVRGPLPAPHQEVPSGFLRDTRVYARGAYEELYQDAVLASRGRPVSLLYDSEHGLYRVLVGSEPDLSLLEQGWELVASFRPQSFAVGVTRLPIYEHQVMELYKRFLRYQRRTRMFIEHDIPGIGRGRTEVGFDPSLRDGPFYIRIHRVVGPGLRGKGRFATEERHFTSPAVYFASLKK